MDVFDEARDYGVQLQAQRKAIKELEEKAWWTGFAIGCVTGSVIACAVAWLAVLARRV